MGRRARDRAEVEARRRRGGEDARLIEGDAHAAKLVLVAELDVAGPALEAVALDGEDPEARGDEVEPAEREADDLVAVGDAAEGVEHGVPVGRAQERRLGRRAFGIGRGALGIAGVARAGARGGLEIGEIGEGEGRAVRRAAERSLSAASGSKAAICGASTGEP